MGLQLYNQRGTVGGLNLYSTERDTIDPEAPAIADLFAAHAAIVLGHVREVTHLREALTTRQLIGQASGVIMERYARHPRQPSHTSYASPRPATSSSATSPQPCSNKPPQRAVVEPTDTQAARHRVTSVRSPVWAVSGFAGTGSCAAERSRPNRSPDDRTQKAE